MAQIGFSCPRGLIKHTECKRCAQDPLHPCHLTADVLERMRVDPDDRHSDPHAFSPSTILGCDRQAALQADSDYYTDVEAAWPMLRGSMVHALMEKNDYPGALGVIRELDFETNLQTRYGEVSFFGKPDLIVVTGENMLGYTVKIVDYKSTNEIKHELTAARDEHVMQVNMYAWLVERELAKHLKKDTHIFVTELEILYADMKKTRRFTSAGGLTARGKLVSRSPRRYETLSLHPIPLLPTEVTEDWVRGRIEQRLRALEEELPPPLEDDEAWRCINCPVRELCFSLAMKEEAG